MGIWKTEFMILDLKGRTTAAVAAAAILANSSQAAMAADLPYGNPYADERVSAAIYDWTGFYVGAHGGYGWGSAGATDLGGFVGGIQAGYTMQSDRFVMGVEGDVGFQPGRLGTGTGSSSGFARFGPRPHRSRDRSDPALWNRRLQLRQRHRHRPCLTR